MNNILIVDDEIEIVKLLRIYLETEDYNIFQAYDGVEATEILEKENIDLAVVDIIMPKMDSYQLIKYIRSNFDKYIPIIVISAKVTLSDRILGMDIGADDYITKPFEPLEVAAKIRAQMRRKKMDSLEFDEVNEITVGDVSLNLNECNIRINREIIELTKSEFKVLELLMSQPRRVFTKEQIYSYAWYNTDAVDDNTIRVIINRLREKIGSEHIKTIRGLGYRYE